MSARDAILAVETRRHTALKTVDMDALDAMFSADLVHVHSNGMVHRKPGILAHIERQRAFIEIERGPLDITVGGDIGVMAGPMKSLMRRGSGTVQMAGWVTQVLRNEQGVWRFLVFQFTLNQPA